MIPFGSGSITHWSDGKTTTTQKFGNGQIVNEKDRSGRATTGMVRPFGNGTHTQWNNGTTNRNSGSFNSDTKK